MCYDACILSMSISAQDFIIFVSDLQCFSLLPTHTCRYVQQMAKKTISLHEPAYNESECARNTLSFFHNSRRNTFNIIPFILFSDTSLYIGLSSACHVSPACPVYVCVAKRVPYIYARARSNDCSYKQWSKTLKAVLLKLGCLS